MRAALQQIPLARLREAGLLDQLLGLADPGGAAGFAAKAAAADAIDEMDAEALIALALESADDVTTEAR